MTKLPLKWVVMSNITTNHIVGVSTYILNNTIHLWRTKLYNNLLLQHYLQEVYQNFGRTSPRIYSSPYYSRANPVIDNHNTIPHS